MSYKTYSVAASYRKTGWRIKARSQWDAIVLIPQIRFQLDATRVRQHSWGARYYSRTWKTWVDVWRRL